MKFLYLFFGCFFLANAQREPFHGYDSLQAVYRTAPADSVKVQTLFLLAEKALASSPADAMPYCLRALELSRKADYDPGLENAYGWLAYLYEQQGKIPEALAYYRKSLSLSEKIGDRKNQSTVLNNIAAIYKDRGKSSKRSGCTSAA